MSISLATAASGLATLLLCWVVGTVAVRIFFQPLSSIPGPKRALLDWSWYPLIARDGHARSLALTLHKKYGHAVRVSTNEVWFDSEDAFKIIYKPGSGFEKADFYMGMSLGNKPDSLDLLTERDMDRYKHQRRVIGRVYGIANIRRHERLIDGALEAAVSRIRALDGAEVDLREWMHIIVVECLSAVVLSRPAGLLRAGSDGGTGDHAYAAWRMKSVVGLFPWIAARRYTHRRLVRLFCRLMKVTYSTPPSYKTFFTTVHQRITSRIKDAAARHSRQQRNRRPPADLMTDLIELHEARPDDFPQDHLRRMAMTNFGAGHETLTSTLTSVLVMLGTHAESAGVRVQAECRSMTKFAAAERGSATVVPYDAVVCTRSSAGLPYTVAAIREAQRLHPVIGMSLARVVPPGGAVIDGHFLPAGTTVGCVPAALHRNRALFGDNADEFVPERWLSTPTPGGAVAGGQKTTGEDTPQPTAAATTGGVPVLERDRYPSLAWGGGARTCPGRNLAELILLKAVPTLVREFDLHLVHVPPEEEMRTYFMAMMTGVRVRFVARKTAGGSSSGERDST